MPHQLLNFLAQIQLEVMELARLPLVTDYCYMGAPAVAAVEGALRRRLSLKQVQLEACGFAPAGAPGAAQRWKHLFCVSGREAAFCEISFLFFYF